MHPNGANIDNYLAILRAADEKVGFAPGALSPDDASIGYSGESVLRSLEGLTAASCQSSERCYLEIGVFRGLTLVSVAHANPSVACFGIDNFSQFDPSGHNKGVVEARADRLGLKNMFLIEADFEEALQAQLAIELAGRKIGMYFIDGPHDYRSQLICLGFAKPYLADGCVIVVDDSNYQHIRLANRDFLLMNTEFKLLFEAYGNAHPGNLSKDQHEGVRRSWWNGINVIVHDPNNVLSPIYPDCDSDRSLFFNEHIVQSSKMAELAPQALAAFESIFRPWNAPRRFGSLLRGWWKGRGKWSKRYPSMNTFSSALPTQRYASIRPRS